jgi:DNA-binding beta-propeller fold protein YncE
VGNRGERRRTRWPALCALPVALALLYASAPAGAASARDAVEVRSILTGEFGFARPAGLAYMRSGNLLLIAASGGRSTRVLRLGPFEDRQGTITLPRLSNPSTLAFDPDGARLAAVSRKKLLVVQSAHLDRREPTVQRVDIAHLGLRNPQGATFDPESGALLILDSGAQELVRISSGSRLRETPVRYPLRNLGARRLRGLALNPADGLLYVASPDRDLLYGLSRSGKIRTAYSIKKAALRNPTALVFAPSADTTDPRGTQHLYVADAGGPSALGRVVELSLAKKVAIAETVTGTLAQTLQTWQLGTPAPDPAGITYLATTDTLMITDSEVDEMPLYRGANLFRLTPKGALVDSGTTLAFSREPTGVGFNPGSGALYISDDVKDRVFVVMPGGDGRYGTADDSVSSISTAAFGSMDPEGVEYDAASGHLFVADGSAKEVYDIDPVNGVLGDGDDVATHFDVAKYGIRNFEGVGFDPQRGTLLVVDGYERRIFELTRTGKLVRIISLSTLPFTNLWLASVTVAPTSNPSDSPSAMSYWVADRHVDNNTNPNENDGRIYEVTVS